MPVRERSNYRLLPANARAADVAEKAVNEIIPIQQRRYYDAFRVQGIAAVHYTNLKTGRKCNCQSSQKQINGLLNEQGKASEGHINELLTAPSGAAKTNGSFSFNITPYNQDQAKLGVPSTQTSPFAPVNKNQGVFDIVTPDDDFGFADNVVSEGFGDNGPVSDLDLDAMVGDFDASAFGYSDVSCPVCFGSGFVGGYTPYHAHRQVLTVADMQMDAHGEIDMLKRPWVAHTIGFSVIVILPRGAIGVDAFRLWNMADVVNVPILLDGQALTSTTQLLSKCDGRPHVVSVSVPAGFSFTHLEMQFNLTTESVYFEFPRRGSSADTALLEQMEPFQIIVSPNLPAIDSEDVIVESQLGKVLLVQNSNPWNSRNRAVLGWEVQVRVIQPQELYRILPRRGRVMTKDATTQMIRDNVTGPRRT
jgi:hypothetical protein